MIAWVAPALGSPIVYSFVSIADKALLSRFGLGLPGFNLFVGLSQLLISVVILAVDPLPSVDGRIILGGLSAGALHGAGLVLMFWVLRREEVSRVVPVAQITPIFVALIAAIVLDETLGIAQWAAVVLAVAGAGLVSLKRDNKGGDPYFPGPFAVLLLSALLVAGAQLLIKVTTNELSIWNTLALRGIGLSVAMSVLFARPAAIIELGRFLARRRQGPFLVAAEMLLPLIGNLLLVAAIARGPVSLATALLGTRPLFVFGVTVLGSRIAPGFIDEKLDRQEVVIKLASALMVVTAVALIATN